MIRWYQNPSSLRFIPIKKLIRTLLVSVFFAIGLLFLLSALFPRTWIVLDDIRLFFQRHIITIIAEFRYRSVVGQKVELPDLLSKKRLAPGDILFTAEESSLGSIFITGKWKHTLIYLGTLKQLKLLLGTSSPWYQTLKKLDPHNESKRILESSFEGVQLKPLTALKESEALLALRVELPKKQIAS